MEKHYKRVLLIDDDSVSNYINEMALQEMNISDRIHISENGNEALDYLNQHCCNKDIPSGECPDLIFLDINMPVMDGFQFLEEFEKLPFYKTRPVRIVMLTSSSAGKDMDKAKKYNVDGYIVKPLCKDKLDQALSK